MHDRIKEVRTALGLSQQEFADRIGIKRGAVANYEVGRNEPIDAIISLICREFHVDEHWLRTGDGKMFTATTRDEEIMDFVGRATIGKGDDFKRRFLLALARLPEDPRPASQDIARKSTPANTKQEQA